MTRFRMISRCGEGLALLRKIQGEGHECDFWTPPSVPGDLYEGMIPRCEQWREGLDDETVVLFDAPGSGRLAGEIPLSWGAGTLNDALQFDRAFGLKIAKVYDLKVPAWQQFTEIAEAIAYLQGQEPDSRWTVELPAGEVFYENYPTGELVNMLELSESLTDFYCIQHVAAEPLTLQGWYVRGELVAGSLFSTVERQRFLAWDYGPICQAPACVGWFWPPKQRREGETTPTLYRQTLKKLEPFMRQHAYSGPLCLKVRIGPDGLPWFYGFETGFRYPAVYVMAEGIHSHLGEVFAAMAQGQRPALEVSYDWLGSVAISIPPYPYYAGVPNHWLRGELDNPHIWLLDAKQVDGHALTAGAHGLVAQVTAMCEPAKENLSVSLLAMADRMIQVKDKQMRRDGWDISSMLGLLRRWHYF